MVYNIPYRTGVNIELETLQALAADPRITAIKECGGTIERMLRLVHETPLRVLAGEDNQVFAALCVGAHGAVSASAHIHPRLHVRLLDYVRQGDLARARRLAVALRPIVADVFSEPNPAPVKAYLAQEGWCEAAVRLPFLPASESLGQRLRSQAQALAMHT
jgi:4-hydroxy-tetrahydrodipicolinate synthase